MSNCGTEEKGPTVHVISDGASWRIIAGEECFQTDSLPEVKNKLIGLREAGLHVPDGSIAWVEEELGRTEEERKEYREKLRREIEDAMAAGE